MNDHNNKIVEEIKKRMYSGSESLFYIVYTLIDYLELEEKLQHPEKQSFYFQKGIENHKQQLAKYKNDFEKNRTDFNKHTEQDYRDLIAKTEEKIKQFKNTPVYTYTGRHSRHTTKNSLSYYRRRLRQKQKLTAIRPFEEYLQVPEKIWELVLGELPGNTI